ncbi:hypothetical protein HZY88_04715 [Aerococcaceae bacterium DSM 111176]|nr:hypothetical protein [Aerococcaceae bacterium DSM 111176]
MKKKIMYDGIFLIVLLIVSFVMDTLFLLLFDRTLSEIVRDFVTTLISR